MAGLDHPEVIGEAGAIQHEPRGHGSETVETIFALSSGSPPAAIAIVRVSGPASAEAVRALAGRLPEPRRASAATLRHPQSGEVLDRALILYFPGPETATGEDLAELHLHGGRSVVAAVLGALALLPGLRAATAGEFTRRAFENGRIDLAEAEGLADLLAAETESQRRAALALAGGALSRLVCDWQDRILQAAAQIEAELDFSDEDATGPKEPTWQDIIVQIAKEVRTILSKPALERLKEGVRVVVAGPPNVGKSTLINALAERDAAITSPIPGTTRDVVEVPVAIDGVPFLFSDTAGLRDSIDEIEAIGIRRAQDTISGADIVLWLGGAEEAPDLPTLVRVQAKADVSDRDPSADISISAKTGMGMEALVALLTKRGRALLPVEGEVATNARHRTMLTECLVSLEEALVAPDLLVSAEAIRSARAALDRVTGRAGVEDVLDALFGRFCIGK